MYQGIFDTDFDKYTEDAVALFISLGVNTVFENLEGFPMDWKTNPEAFVKFVREHQCPSCVVGWFLGGPGVSTRRVLALGTAQRNIAAALVVGSQSFTDPKVVVMVVVVAIVSLLILMPLSRKLANSDDAKRSPELQRP